MAAVAKRMDKTQSISSNAVDYQSINVNGKFHRTQSTPVAKMDPYQRVQFLEVENRRLMSGQGQLIQETNRKIQMHLNEIRMLKEENKRLLVENSELRDLCCFLDDDRQRTKRLSREWQRFGRYTANVMKQEVEAYQEKLKELENRQTEFVSENSELKQLCLYLDEQRAKRTTCQHCGSSLNTTPTGRPNVRCLETNHAVSSPDDCDGGSGRSSDSENHKPEADRNLPEIPAGETPKFLKLAPFPVQIRKSRPVIVEQRGAPSNCSEVPECSDKMEKTSKVGPGFIFAMNGLGVVHNPPGENSEEDSPFDVLVRPSRRNSTMSKPTRSISMIAIPFGEQNGAEEHGYNNNNNLNNSGKGLVEEPGLIRNIRSLEERVKYLESKQFSVSASPSGIFTEDLCSVSSPNLSATLTTPSSTEVENKTEHNMKVLATEDPLVASQQSTGSSVGTSVTYGSSGSGSPITALYIQEEELVDDSEDTGFETERFLQGSSSGSTLTPIDEAEECESMYEYSNQMMKCPDSVSESSLDSCSFDEILMSLPRPLRQSSHMSYSEPTCINSTQFLPALSNNPKYKSYYKSGPLLPLSRHTSMVTVDNNGPCAEIVPHGGMGWCSVAAQGKSLSEALKVLEIQEMINSRRNGEMSAEEKAIINTMCNVAWKTIDEQDVTPKSSSRNSNLTMTAL